MDFPGDSVVKNLPANAGDVGLISGSVRSPGVGNGNLLLYSCLWGHKESYMTERLSTQAQQSKKENIKGNS